MIAKAIPGEGADALAARTMAHAAVNAALAKAQGNNVLAGAAGAVTAEMMPRRLSRVWAGTRTT